MDFDDHKEIIQARADAQEVDHDRREIMREVNTFITKKGGQWEQDVWDKFEQFKRPRYTFDRCKPIRNQIWGAIADQEFAIKVKPMGGGASDDTAQTYSGLIRNIESMSVATDVYEQAIKKGIDIGFGCWRIEQDWADSDAFDQDLFIRPVHNAVDRVWFIGYFESPVAEDAEAVSIDHTISLDEYKERFGEDRGPQSLGEDRSHSEYYYKREGILIGELIYKEKITKTLYMTPEGDVVDEAKAEEMGLPLDELKSRERETFKVMTRFYDGGGWLTEPEETVFDHLPVVPVWPNFEITDNKVITCGAIEWLMDEQRVHNYAVSRAVEDAALSPKPKLLLTYKQAKSPQTRRQLATMNQNNEPAILYDTDPESQPPFQVNMTAQNAALSELIAMSAQATEASSGMYGPNLAKNEGIQSGVAIEKQQHKGDIGTIEYFKAVKRSIIQTGKILVHAIPKVYEQGREIRIMNEDGTYEMVSIHEQVMTDEGVVTYNDLQQGIYDVTCDIGPAYRTRQEQAADFFERIGQIDPSIVEQGKDIWLQTMDLPGMDTLSERFRAQLLQAGVIPPDQWTEEEQQQAAIAAQQPQEPDPNTVIAQAEAMKAEADMANAQAKAQGEAIKLQQAQDKQQFDQQMQMIKLEQEQVKLEAQQARDDLKALVERDKANAEIMNKMADTLNKIGQSMGVDAIVSPPAVEAYDQQATAITQEQQELG